MIVYMLKISGKDYIEFTTDFSWWYYFKPIIDKMWIVETLGM